MIRTTYGQGRYSTGEFDVVLGTAQSWAGEQPKGVIYCHGGQDTAATAFTKPAQRSVMTSLAEHATVHVGDLGGDTFGNDTSVTRMEEAVAYLRSAWGQSGPLVLVGVSMGFIVATNYALRNPEEVRAIAGIIPGTDLASLHGLGGITETLIDAAYPPGYDDLTDGPDHSPVQFADQLDPAQMAIHLFTSSNDNMALPATADAFIAARPETSRTDLGALGHTETAIAAAKDGVAEFVLAYL